MLDAHWPTDGPDRDLGYWSQKTASLHAETQSIGAWAAAKAIDTVVWTALRPKFSKKIKVPSETDVLTYLNNAEGQQREKAEKYIRRAPAQNRTPYRIAIERELKWEPSPVQTPPT